MTPQPSVCVGWKVEVDGVPCIVFAETKTKARWKAVAAYREAGYGRRGEWPRVTAWRAEEFDGMEPTGGLQNRTGCYAGSYLVKP